MRKNVKQQLALRVLSTAALMAMVSSIATAAFAAEYNVTDGSVEIVAKDGIQRITQWEDKDNDTCVKDGEGKEIRDRKDSNIILTTKNETTDETEATDETETTDKTKPTSNTVTITAEDGNTANVTLKDVHIETKSDSDSAPIEIKGDGNTNLELNGDNTVLSGSGKHAGIEKADVNGTGTLTIKDDKNDDGTVKKKDKNGNAVGGDTGELLAGGCYLGAGIGAGRYQGNYYTEDKKDEVSTSNITITGGKITASGGEYAAGIGGSSHGDASNIRIEGNADVTAFGSHGAAIGSGDESTGNSDITITDHATVDAASEQGCAIGGGEYGSGKVTVTISGHASVNAEALDVSPAAIGGHLSSATVNIEDHAAVTAVSRNVAIGTGVGTDGWGSHGMGATSTVINITGGTVNAVTRSNNPRPAIGTACGNLDVTINSSTGKTTVNTYTTSSDPLPLIGTAGRYGSPTSKYGINPSEGAEYNEDGSSHLGEDNAAIINFYHNTPLGTDTSFKEPTTLDPDAFHATLGWQNITREPKHTLSDKDKGDLYKVVHNRKYMEEHPEIVDISKLKDDDLHAWEPVPGGEYKKPTLEEDGYADCICGIDKCGQTKRVVLPKLTPEPSEPDVPGGNTPDTPNKPDTPKQPDGTTPAPVTPDAPVQDVVPDTAPADTAVTPDAVQADVVPADAAVTPAAAQNVVQDAKPEAAATAAVSAAALPQTGANWLAVVGSALSGLFLLAAGFVLDRKNRRMN